MPCFGTTEPHAFSNAGKLLAEELGVSASMTVDIGASPSAQALSRISGTTRACTDVTYENWPGARAHAAAHGYGEPEFAGMVVGTGDLSRARAGLGDLQRRPYVDVRRQRRLSPRRSCGTSSGYEMPRCIGGRRCRGADRHTRTRPFPPSCLPATDDGRNSRSERRIIVGPYELHDFFLYYSQRLRLRRRRGFSISQSASFDGRILTRKCDTAHGCARSFGGSFAQQFKRSCLPDGPKVGTVTLSPRGDWRMPSDASANLWLKEIDALRAGD